MKQLVKEYIENVNFLYKIIVIIYNDLLILKQIILNPLAYIRHYATFKVIAGPNFLGYKGGICNPGVVLADHDHTIMIAKGLIHHWLDARGAHYQHYLKGVPIMLSLDRHSRVQQSHEIHQLPGFPSADNLELEDFRLFHFQSEFWVNHNLIQVQRSKNNVGYSASFPSLSRLDPEQKTLTFLGYPQVDFPIQTKEKNWVFIEHHGELYLFYSFYPYRILQLTDRQSLTFATTINQALSPALGDIGGFGTIVSFSTNPIPYDHQHFLLLIHQIDPTGIGRLYYHWAVLIDKNSFYPTKVTAVPLFSGLAARGRLKGVIYITSVINQDDDFIFYGGEGDTYLSYAQVSKQRLDSLWRNISNDQMTPVAPAVSRG